MDQDPLNQKPINTVPTAGNPLSGFRSFAADIEAAKKGEAPGTENPSGIAGKSETLHAGGNTLKTFEAATAKPAPIPKLDPQIAIDTLHKEEEGAIPKFRSFQSDISNTINTKKTSVIQIAIAEQEKRRPEVTDDPKKSIFALALSGLLILGGIIAIIVFMYIRNIPVTPPLPNIDTKTIIPSEISKDFQVSSSKKPTDGILSLIATPEEKSYKILKANFLLGSTTLDSSKFFTLSKLSASPSLIRALGPEYIAGVYKDTEPKLFMVFKVNSYDNAFAGMLLWEQTLAVDLENFVSASTTLESSFVDMVIKNKDARVLKSKAGEPIILYSFSDNNTLVITMSQNAMEEIFARLVATKFVR